MHHIRVFGSVARGKADEWSDVDFLVDLEPGRSLLDLGGLLIELRQLLGRDVDVVTERGLRSKIRERVLSRLSHCDLSPTGIVIARRMVQEKSFATRRKKGARDRSGGAFESPLEGKDAYNRFVITRGIRELVERDWDAAREAKDRYWAERIAALGAAEGFRIAEELRIQALLHDPAWPHAEERREDLEAHIRLAGVFRRAGSASRR